MSFRGTKNLVPQDIPSGDEDLLRLHSQQSLGTLYVGVTNNLMRRLHEHREGVAGSFTARYRINRLVYVESANYVEAVLNREKEIKGWVRRRKIELIAGQNPK